LARWHEATRTVLERHGGTVEKFVGDAVMAVFGSAASSKSGPRARRTTIRC
jgi:class 3 adenylate cyclase